MDQNKRYIHIGILLTILAVLCSVNEKYKGTDKSETAPVCDITNTTIEDLKTALKERREKMENRIDKERLLFEKYKDSLYGLEEDSTRLAVLGENGWEQTEGCYREILWESFYGQSIITDTGLDSEDPEDMWGVLILEKPQPNLTGMRAAMYEMGSVTEYVYFDNWDIIWFARRGGSKKEREVPEYQVCEGVLNCAGVTLTGREERWDEWMESYGQEVSGAWEEYCVADGHVYRLDLENRRLLDVTEGIESCMAQWLTWEAERAVCGMQTEPMDVEMIRSMLPEEYRMSDRERITGCDLNHDGTTDYVVSVYRPEEAQYDEYRRLLGDQLWLYLSDGAGYRKKVLEEGDIQCAQLEFVSEGTLACVDRTGFERYGVSPWRMEYFMYDEAAEDFYLARVYLGKGETMLCQRQNSLERVNLHTYYHGYDSKINQSLKDKSYEIKLEDGRRVRVIGGITYSNRDKEKEKAIQDQITRLEYLAVEDIAKNGKKDEKYVNVRVVPEYLNERILSGVVGRIWFNIDIESGKLLRIQELVPFAEMAEICRRGMKSKSGEALDNRTKEKYLQAMEEEYEKINSLQPCGEKVSLKMIVNAWGMYIACDGRGFRVDKEYFADTPLWNYMKPAF